MDTIVLRGTGRQEDDGHDAEERVLAKPPAEIEAISAGNHDVEQEEGGRLPFCVGEDLVDGQVWADGKPRTFKVVLHQPGDVGVIFQHKDRLTQCLNLVLHEPTMTG